MADDDDRTTEVMVMDTKAVEQITRGEVDIQISTAHKYPRSIQRFLVQSKDLATINKATARSCFYRLPRDEWDPVKKTYVPKIIEGASIRLAEICASTFGNIRHGARVIEIGRERISVMGMAHDLESNNLEQCELTGSILNKYGERYKEHMISTTANALCAKAKRNALLVVIPRAYVDQIMRVCKETALGKNQTMVERWKELLSLYAGHRVEESSLLEYVEREGFADVTMDNMIDLHGILTAVEEGEISMAAALDKRSSGGEAKRSDIADGPPPEAPAAEQPADQKAEDDESRAKNKELMELRMELSKIDEDATAKVTQGAPNIDAALVELSKLKTTLVKD